MEMGRKNDLGICTVVWFIFDYFPAEWVGVQACVHFLVSLYGWMGRGYCSGIENSGKLLKQFVLKDIVLKMHLGFLVPQSGLDVSDVSLLMM